MQRITVVVPSKCWTVIVLLVAASLLWIIIDLTLRRVVDAPGAATTVGVVAVRMAVLVRPGVIPGGLVVRSASTHEA